MNEYFRYFPYIIRDILISVRAEYDVSNLKPYFEFGTYHELTKRIAIKDANDSGKYPLVWLVWEANESIQNWTWQYGYTVSPRLFVCNFTSSDYSSIERYEANFVNILFPIWELFKEHLKYNKFISTKGEFTFQLAEHLLWGESLGFQKNENILFDTLDSIEIKFNNLEINKIC